ncbi:MAG: urease accessory protein UreD [Planctomycetaceae bacterium]
MRHPHLLPELAPYQDEPKQLPTGSPGKVAELRLGFERRGERTILADLYRRAPLIVHRAIYWDEELPEMPCVFMISNSGGILQGDRNTISLTLEPGAQAHVTTQSATKVHEMDANFASQTQQIVLREGTYLEYLPDPLIPHKHMRFATQTRIVIDPTATLLYSEILMGGRKHYGDGELFEYDLFSSTIQAARPDDSPLFIEKFIVRPRDNSVRQAGIMGPYDVFGNVVLLTPKHHADRIFEQVPAVFDAEEQWASGASRLPHDAGLIYKIVGMETEVVRSKVREFWSLVREEVVGARVMPEFAWR